MKFALSSVRRQCVTWIIFNTFKKIDVINIHQWFIHVLVTSLVAYIHSSSGGKIKSHG